MSDDPQLNLFGEPDEPLEESPLDARAPTPEPEPAAADPEPAAAEPEPAETLPAAAPPPLAPPPARPSDQVSAPTAEQAAAIAARDGDVFCEAGAGSGKTRVLVGRYCDALTEDEVAIDSILAFTFTERAAAELRARIRSELGRRARLAAHAGDPDRAAELRTLARETERAWVTTIHGFCRRLLGAHPVAAGLDPRFRVLDGPEAARLLEQASRDALDALVEAGDEQVTRAAAAYRPDRFAGIALTAHERLRSQGMSEPRLPAVDEPVASRKGRKDPEPLTPPEREAALGAREALERLLEGLHVRYAELKGGRSGLDFSDLELATVELLRTSSAVAALWSERFEHLMVDEFQDTNAVQLELIERLRGPQTKLFTVGDEQQSIYRFRAADLEVFRAQRSQARRDEATKVMALRGNFRSDPGVLAVANEIGRTMLPEFSELTSGRPSAEPAPVVDLLLTLEEGKKKNARTWNAEELDLNPPPSVTQQAVFAEALALAERLRELVDAGEAEAGEIVVLLRAFTHVDAYEEALDRFGLDPYVVGGRGYWSQQQVEDLLRLLSCIANPLDDEMLFGALAGPGCEVSPDALWLLRRAAASENHVWPVIAHVYGGEEHRPNTLREERVAAIDAADAERLTLFCERLAALRSRAALTPLDSLVELTMDTFDYDLALLAQRGGRGRMANVRKLMRLASEYERNEGRDLRGFLDQAARSTERDEREGMAPVNAEDHDGARIMTVHGAKGLEFPVVAVPDMGRRLNAGHRSEDLWIGRRGVEGAEPRFGMRLAFPSAGSRGVWELYEMAEEEKVAEAEEACRLLYVGATRAQRRLVLSGAYRPDQIEQADEHKPGDSAIRRLLPALAASGWDGSAGEVRIPAPLPIEDTGSGAPAETAITVRVSSPSPERASALSSGRESLAPAATAPPEGTKPPLLPGGPSPVPLGHLSYSALASFERCGYRFYLERVLGVREGEIASSVATDETQESPEREGPASDELPEPESTPIARATSPALALGNTVHLALEWSARSDWADPGAQRIAALLAREGLAGDDQALERATALLAGWMESPLLEEMNGRQLRPEAPFTLGVAGTVLRGSIDLLGVDPANGAAPLVVDFKTDMTGGRELEELGQRYAGQRAVYALAVAAALETDEVRTAHVFLEQPGKPVIETFDAAGLQRARSELERLIAEVRKGEFEVAGKPYAAMCFRCPAAARLCPRPAWRPKATA